MQTRLEVHLELFLPLLAK